MQMLAVSPGAHNLVICEDGSVREKRIQGCRFMVPLGHAFDPLVRCLC